MMGRLNTYVSEFFYGQTTKFLADTTTWYTSYNSQQQGIPYIILGSDKKNLKFEIFVVRSNTKYLILYHCIRTRNHLLVGLGRILAQIFEILSSRTQLRPENQAGDSRCMGGRKGVSLGRPGREAYMQVYMYKFVVWLFWKFVSKFIFIHVDLPGCPKPTPFLLPVHLESPAWSADHTLKVWCCYNWLFFYSSNIKIPLLNSTYFEFILTYDVT